MTDIHANLIAKLDAMAHEFALLDEQLSDPQVVVNHDRVRELSIRRAALAGLVDRYRQYRAVVSDIEEYERTIAGNEDAELVQLARAELPTLKQNAGAMLEQISGELVTADDLAIGSVILEIRAASGGDEAALWAGDLYQMYQRYIDRKDWSMQTLDISPGDMGGLRQLVASVQGPGVWQGFGYEGGVHCVKRVPATETQGRIHTSTATVAVLPEPQQLQINIPESDVKIHVTTAQGPGGQNVNKVATAVNMVHIPTGIEVRMQESKSQQQNRAKAWQLLRARVFDHYQRIKHTERAEQRSKMIGSGERSQRIRTYRYKENIVVDHRTNQSANLDRVLAGELDELVQGLIAQDRAQRLASL